jgi:hypothetical protein
MRWASNGEEKVGLASIYHLTGMVLNTLLKKPLS